MTRIVGFCVVGTLGALVVSGCASKSVVKKDEALIPPVSTQAKQTNAKETKIVPPVSTVTKAPDKATPESIKNTASKADSQQLASALEKIYFDFNSDSLSDQARKTLTSDADYLRKRAISKLRIEGNCDERGSAEYNIALGEKRAEVAKKYLVTLGVPADRLAIISYGKEKPVDPGHDESAWAKNRRDDFTILAN